MLDQPHRERAFNVPAVVLGLLAALVLVHVILTWVLTSEETTQVLLLFAFIPARFDPDVLPDIEWPGGWAANVWTFVTYALIHSNISHLVFNAVWLVAFATPVARRFGVLRFMVFMAATAAVGAAVHLATHFGELLPMIGASAAISGAMGGTMRFAFQPGGPLGFWRDGDNADRVPALPLLACFRDPRVLAFLLIWFVSNLLIGLFAAELPGVQQAVAWQAHIGGLLAGLLGFSLFDPVGQGAAATGPERDTAKTETLH
jgi:membrane associated rhomboid family serine protease